MRINILRKLGKQIEEGLPAGIFCWLKNITNRLSGWKHTLRVAAINDRVLVVSDSIRSIFICRRCRHTHYKRGVLARATKLAREYHLPSIHGELRGGVLIDCGANVGELGLWAREMGLKYVAFEPEQLEAHCCDLNNFDGMPRTINKALWHENTTLDFFQKPNSADGSLIEMNHYDSVYPVEAVRLDSALNDADFSGTVILKVEAEGAEPEVLQGASGILPKIAYIAVDCGCERGKEEKHTFVETNNFLTQHGFELHQADFKRVTMLYRNVNKAA